MGVQGYAAIRAAVLRAATLAAWIERRETTMRRIQKNGRERGRLEGVGNGAHQEVSPLARPGVTPSKQEKRNRDDKRRKSRGWDD